MDFSHKASPEVVAKTLAALGANGIAAEFVSSSADAKKRVLELIPKGAEVMTMTSVTVDAIGATDEVNESGQYDAVRPKLNKMDRKKQNREMQQIGAAPDYMTGSAHAVTEDGTIVIASNTGSQLPAIASGAGHVILVVGTQKIVKDLDMAMKRVYEHSLPLESERAKKAYGVPGSSVNKILIIKKEVAPDRVHLIFVDEVLGF
jgi:L-lactate utilization protein LutC